MQVGGEDVGILVDRPVLDHILPAPPDLFDLLDPGIEVIDLQVEGPTLHIVVKVIEVGILFDVLVQGVPIKVFGQQFGQGGFSRSDVS